MLQRCGAHAPNFHCACPYSCVNPTGEPARSYPPPAPSGEQYRHCRVSCFPLLSPFLPLLVFDFMPYTPPFSSLSSTSLLSFLSSLLPRLSQQHPFLSHRHRSQSAIFQPCQFGNFSQRLSKFSGRRKTGFRMVKTGFRLFKTGFRHWFILFSDWAAFRISLVTGLSCAVLSTRREHSFHGISKYEQRQSDSLIESQ